MIPNNESRRKGDRHPKNDPAIHRYVIYLNNVDNTRFLVLYDRSKSYMRVFRLISLYLAYLINQ